MKFDAEANRPSRGAARSASQSCRPCHKKGSRKGVFTWHMRRMRTYRFDKKLSERRELSVCNEHSEIILFPLPQTR